MDDEFTIQQIERDLIFKKFLIKKSGIQPATIDSYLYSLQSFCNFTGKTPTEIHDIHKKDLINRVPEFDMWMNDALDEYISHLIDSKYLYGGIRLNLSRIKSFLHAFKLRPTPTIIISKKQITEDAKYALKVEDIRKAIELSKPTYKTLFITQAQTGLSISDALLLDVEDFVMAVSKKNENLTIRQAINRVKTEDNLIGCFDLRRKKTSAEFYTFAGPEVLRNIASLLEHRDEEYLKPNMPIFMKETARLNKARKETLIKDLRLNRKTIGSYLTRMHKNGIFPRIKVGGKERNYFRTHKLRKWFSNQLRFEAGFNTDDVKYLMGQKTGDVIEQYINPNNYNALKANYRKALPYLSINDEIIMEENQEAIEGLTQELQVYKDDSKAKDAKMEKLEKKQEFLEEMVKKLMKEKLANEQK
jgi:integrase